MKIRIMTVGSNESFNAGPKAPRDIIKILEKKYDLKSIYLIQSDSVIKKILYRFKMLNNIIASRIKKEILILQFPMYENSKILNKFFMFSLKKAKKDNLIIVIHDLEGLRKNDKIIERQEIERLNMAKYIVAHNGFMKNYLEKNGVKSKIYTLDLFDYLCEEKNNETSQNKNDSKVKVVYAGNLNEVKSPFIHQIDDDKINFKFMLYGVGLDSTKKWKNIQYNGKFSPEELPNKLDGELGLIWDGNFDESDETIGMKRYTKYNNPHKLSCYMAAEIPVIVWKKAAIAKFVSENNIGYLIDSIYDINNLDFNNYIEKYDNVKLIGKKVKSGFYTTKTFEKIIEDISQPKDEI